jgi:hypothetical protein
LFSDRPRLKREYKTFAAMMRIYCREQHGVSASLCPQCQELLDYARQRLEKCPFQEEKPTCANCKVHCYRPDMRERAREMMRFSGPRMIFRHPLLALRHLLDGRRPTPTLPRKRSPRPEKD